MVALPLELLTNQGTRTAINLYIHQNHIYNNVIIYYVRVTLREIFRVYLAIALFFKITYFKLING